MIRELLKKFLTGHGHEVAVADTGEEGLKRVHESPPSLKGVVIKPTLTSLGFGGKDNCGLPTYVERPNLVEDLTRRGARCADIW